MINKTLYILQYIYEGSRVSLASVFLLIGVKMHCLFSRDIFKKKTSCHIYTSRLFLLRAAKKQYYLLGGNPKSPCIKIKKSLWKIDLQVSLAGRFLFWFYFWIIAYLFMINATISLLRTFMLTVLRTFWRSVSVTIGNWFFILKAKLFFGFL